MNYHQRQDYSLHVWLGRTIASGFRRSINNEIAGKTTSDVSGVEDVKATVAKELNATRSGTPVPRTKFKA
jgi:hypothetical protein